MEEEISLEEYQDAYRKMRMEEEKKGFWSHLTVFILINIMFIVINYLYTPGNLWFFYPLIGWGIGITLHYMNTTRWVKSELKEKEAIAEKRAKEEK